MSKLKKALFEIEGILQQYDVAGLVVLHTPGETDSMLKVSPSYSCARLDKGNIKVKAKPEDFNGDLKIRQEKLENTYNMLKLLVEATAEAVYPYLEIAEKLGKAIEDDKARRNQV